jgi:heme exporter protein A
MRAPRGGAAAIADRTASHPAFELEGLERHFGDRPALEGISARLERGKTLGVFGANGAGKTTLLRVLATLLRPHGGAIQVLGAKLPGEAWKVRGGIGYLGHDPLLYRELTGRENLRFYARLHGAPEARIEELVAAVGMEGRAQERVGDLSRGMVQRLAAARAVLSDPALLLLDEPWANVDPAAKALLDPVIGPGSGRTRVVATHDTERGLAECDSALGLRAGRQVFAGRAEAADVRALYR